MKSINHHLHTRNGTYYVVFRRRGKQYWKTTKVKDVVKAREVRDCILKELKESDVNLEEKKRRLSSAHKAIQLRNQLRETMTQAAYDGIFDEVLDEAEDIAIKENALAVFKGFEDGPLYSSYKHEDFIQTARGMLTPLAVFKDSWLAKIENKKTMRNYQRGVEVLIKDFTHAEEIDFHRAKKWLRDIALKEKVKPQTTAKWVSAYKSFWAFMEIEDKSPWKDQKVQTKDKQGYLCWKISDVRKLLEAASRKNNSQPWLFHAINIAAHTGARIDAVFDLVAYNEEWDAIIFPKKKKEARDRVVACHPNIKASVQWWLNKQNERPKNSKQMSRGFGDFKRKLGFNSERLVFHSFRHTVVKYLKNVGCPTSIIAGIIGHENTIFTISKQGYGQGTTPADITRAWINKIDYSAADWKELDQEPINLDLTLKYSENEFGL